MTTREAPASARPEVRGLRVQKHYSGTGWEIIHEESGVNLGLWLRLRRHCEAVLVALAGTGVDFTLPPKQVRTSAVSAVIERWKELETHCCGDDGEHYSWQTYMQFGRCVGALSRGLPRRS